LRAAKGPRQEPLRNRPVERGLADGRLVIYTYDGKCGPRIHGEEGSDEWLANLGELRTRRLAAPGDTLASIIDKFEETEEFRSKAERTRADYRKIIDKQIKPKFGTFPIKALVLRQARGEFKGWRDKLALRSRRQADYAWVVLARILSVALDRGWIKANPCARGGRLYHGSRADKIWTPEQVEAFLAYAPEHLRLALLLALYTGQRQGDLLRLKWFAYDGERLRLQQSKTGRHVRPKVHSRLKVVLDAKRGRADEFILLTSGGTPWTEDGFRRSWAKACDRAGIHGVTFHDLRGTFVKWAGRNGATAPEIADNTGQSVEILDKHYLCRDGSLGDRAISKLEIGTETPKHAPKRPHLIFMKEGKR
jgi:integrase